MAPAELTTPIYSVPPPHLLLPVPGEGPVNIGSLVGVGVGGAAESCWLWCVGRSGCKSIEGGAGWGSPWQAEPRLKPEVSAGCNGGLAGPTASSVEKGSLSSGEDGLQNDGPPLPEGELGGDALGAGQFPGLPCAPRAPREPSRGARRLALPGLQLASPGPGEFWGRPQGSLQPREGCGGPGARGTPKAGESARPGPPLQPRRRREIKAEGCLLASPRPARGTGRFPFLRLPRFSRLLSSLLCFLASGGDQRGRTSAGLLE